MKISFITKDILDPDLVLRLKKEGNDVTLYEKIKTKTLLGSIKKLPFSERLDTLGELVIYDDVGFGDESKELRAKGKSVIGGSKMSDTMELDRIKGTKVADLAGIKTLKTQSIVGIKKIIRFLKDNPNRWVLKQEGKLDIIKGLNFVSKTDDSNDLIDYLEWLDDKWVEGLDQTFALQEFIDGVEMACGAYWNGNEFMKDKDGNEVCEENWEHKPMMAGDMGVSTGEMFTIMRYRKTKESQIFKETLDRMRDILKKIDFKGNIDANCIVTKKGVYLLEWTVRFGAPATSAQIAIHKTSWGDFLKACADGKQTAFEFNPQWTIVSWILTSPFPNRMDKKTLTQIEKKPAQTLEEKLSLLEHRLSNSEDLVVDFKEKLTEEELNNVHLEYVYLKDGKIRLANSYGYVFTITGQGETVEEAAEKTEELLNKILVPKGFWRNDFTYKFNKGKDDLIKWGYLEK